MKLKFWISAKIQKMINKAVNYIYDKFLPDWGHLFLDDFVIEQILWRRSLVKNSALDYKNLFKTTIADNLPPIMEEPHWIKFKSQKEVIVGLDGKNNIWRNLIRYINVGEETIKIFKNKVPVFILSY